MKTLGSSCEEMQRECLALEPMKGIPWNKGVSEAAISLRLFITL